MVKRIVFGLIWCVVIYFVACMLVGGVAGGIAGSEHPGNIEAAQRAGQIAGTKAVLEYRPFIIFAAVALAVLGSGAGVLPGTKTRTSRQAEFDQAATAGKF